MSYIIMDQQNKSHRMTLVLQVSLVLNYILLFLQLYFGNVGEVQILTVIIIFNSIYIAIVVSVCGWMFKKNLSAYFSGKFIGRVDLILSRSS